MFVLIRFEMILFSMWHRISIFYIMRQNTFYYRDIQRCTLALSNYRLEFVKVIWGNCEICHLFDNSQSKIATHRHRFNGKRRKMRKNDFFLVFFLSLYLSWNEHSTVFFYASTLTMVIKLYCWSFRHSMPTTEANFPSTCNFLRNRRWIFRQNRSWDSISLITSGLFT